MRRWRRSNERVRRSSGSPSLACSLPRNTGGSTKNSQPLTPRPNVSDKHNMWAVGELARGGYRRWHQCTNQEYRAAYGCQPDQSFSRCRIPVRLTAIGRTSLFRGVGGKVWNRCHSISGRKVACSPPMIDLRYGWDPAEDTGIFGVPTFGIDDERFCGREHLPDIRRCSLLSAPHPRVSRRRYLLAYDSRSKEALGREERACLLPAES